MGIKRGRELGSSWSTSSKVRKGEGGKQHSEPRQHIQGGKNGLLHESCGPQLWMAEGVEIMIRIASELLCLLVLSS